MNEIVNSRNKSTIKIIYQNKLLYDLLTNHLKSNGKVKSYKNEKKKQKGVSSNISLNTSKTYNNYLNTNPNKKIIKFNKDNSVNYRCNNLLNKKKTLKSTNNKKNLSNKNKLGRNAFVNNYIFNTNLTKQNSINSISNKIINNKNNYKSLSNRCVKKKTNKINNRYNNTNSNNVNPSIINSNLNNLNKKKIIEKFFKNI
jgi:hypothetical protein